MAKNIMTVFKTVRCRTRRNDKVAALDVCVPQIMYHAIGLVYGGTVAITLTGGKIIIEKKA